MERILAIVFLFIVLWYGIPVLQRGEWIAPTAIAPGSWMEEAAMPEYQDMLATPSEGYGFYRYDFWNSPSAYGRPLR